MRWSACSDSRLSIDRNFNEESGILGAELLNRPGGSLWIVQPPPAGNANTVWIGGTNDKFSLDIRLPQATFLDRSTELIEDVSLCARGPETAARETRSFLWSRASHSRRRHRERDVACACTCGFALLARKAGGKRGSARLRLKRLAPAVLQWHKTETRISAIAHSVRPCKRKKKALLLFLFAFRRRSRGRRSRKMFSPRCIFTRRPIQDTPIIQPWHAAGLVRQHRPTKVRPVCKRRAVGLGASTNGTNTFVLVDAPLLNRIAARGKMSPFSVPLSCE